MPAPPGFEYELSAPSGFERSSVAETARERHKVLTSGKPNEGRGAVRRFLEGFGIPTTAEGWGQQLTTGVANLLTPGPPGAFTAAKSLYDSLQSAGQGNVRDAVNTYNPLVPLAENIGNENYAGVAGQVAGVALPSAFGTVSKLSGMGARPVKTGRTFTTAGELLGSRPKNAKPAHKVYGTQSHAADVADNVSESVGVNIPGLPVRIYAHKLKQKNVFPVVEERTLGPSSPWEAPTPQKPPVNNPMGTMWAAGPEGPAMPANQAALDAYSAPPTFTSKLVPGHERYGNITTPTILNASPASVTRAALTENTSLLPGSTTPIATPNGPAVPSPASEFSSQSVGLNAPPQQAGSVPPAAPSLSVGFAPQMLDALNNALAFMERIKGKSMPEGGQPGVLPPNTLLQNHRTSQLAAKVAEEQGWNRETLQKGNVKTDKPSTGGGGSKSPK